MDFDQTPEPDWERDFEEEAANQRLLEEPDDDDPTATPEGPTQ